jgi:hypothetical protein
VETEIFLQRGLDSPNQIENSQQIVRQARSLGLLIWPARSRIRRSTGVANRRTYRPFAVAAMFLAVIIRESG